jgi:hypothetical protein
MLFQAVGGGRRQRTKDYRMQDFSAQIKEAEAKIRQADAETAAVSAAFGEVEAAAGDKIAIDIENATLAQVHAHNETMNANVAELIIGLDKVTVGFSDQFSAMRERSGMEKLIGFFSSAKADALRETRVREANIDANLQDLIAKSDTIVSMLQKQLESLQAQKAKVEANLSHTLSEREQVVAGLKAVRTELAALDPRIIELENQISVEQDAAARTKLESQLAEINSKHNALVQDEQVQLARSQTLEAYIEKGKTWVDSLQNQAATQMVLINKLQTDTKQRVVLYDALSKSLKTAQQQDVAHRINEIGTETDQEAQVAMAAIGSATQHRMASMMEQHEDNMVFARKVLEEKAKSDERFARRFAALLEQHDKNLYGVRE